MNSPSRQQSQGGSALRMNHQKFRNYETKRRQAHSSNFDSSQLYWKSYCDLWSAGLQETNRAHRLVLGMSRAQQNLADSMLALYEDVLLDDKGNVMLKQKQRRRLAQSRSTPEQKRVNADDAHSARGSVLTSVRESQKVMSEKLSETAVNIEGEISPEIGRLYQKLSDEYQEMERLGNAIIVEMERTEQEVARAWDAYNTHALDALEDINDGFSMMPSRERAKTSKPNEKSDAWLLEMQYRVVTAYQNEVTEKGNAELSRLFGKMKSGECSRRMHLREYLVAYVQRQQRLYLGMPGVQNPLLEELSGMAIDEKEIEQSIKTAIEERAQKFQTIAKPVESEPEFGAETNLLLESPLSSEMMANATVLECSSSNDPSAKWTVCLAVITADAYLHVFDVPSESVQPGATADNAFETLVPTASTAADGASGAASRQANVNARNWMATLIPSTSMVLGNCTLEVDGCRVEIAETLTGTGASKMFGNHQRHKRVQFRTEDEARTVEWVEALKEVHL